MNFYKACQRKDYHNALRIFETLSESQRFEMANTKILIHTHPNDEYELPVFMFHSVRWYGLLLSYVDVNVRSLMGESTLLMDAICRRSIEEVTFLVGRGADVNMCVNDATPLAVVVDRRYDEMFDIILKGKPSFDVRVYNHTVLGCMQCGTGKRYCDSLHCLIADFNASRELIENVVVKAFEYYIGCHSEKVAPRIASMYFVSVLQHTKLTARIEDFAEMLIRDYGIDGDILSAYNYGCFRIYHMNWNVATSLMIAYDTLTTKFMKMMIELALRCRLHQFKLFLAMGYREPINPKDVIASELSIELYELISGVYGHFDVSNGVVFHTRKKWTRCYSYKACENILYYFSRFPNSSLRQLSYRRIRSLASKDEIQEMRRKILEVQRTKNWRLLLE